MSALMDWTRAPAECLNGLPHPRAYIASSYAEYRAPQLWHERVRVLYGWPNARRILLQLVASGASLVCHLPLRN